MPVPYLDHRQLATGPDGPVTWGICALPGTAPVARRRLAWADPARVDVLRQVADRLSLTGESGLAEVHDIAADDDGFYFIEMNTRLQVEHPVTEAITGIDLVREQIRIAAGAPLSFAQEDIEFSGHAIECRINAENPETFAPSPGRIGTYHTPGGLGVRVDSACYTGYSIPPFYDSMIAKLIVHGRDRVECQMRLKRALEEFVIDGVETTIPLHRRLLEETDVQNGEYNIHWLERFLGLK